MRGRPGLSRLADDGHAVTMGRTWHSVTVELLGGRGEQLWPPPGRVFAVGPSHTFLDLANAINTAFARWDRGHLSMFDLPDGRLVTDPETIAELSGGPSDPIPDALDIGSAEVAGTLEPGAPFRCSQRSPRSKVYRNGAPGSSVPATSAEPISSASGIGSLGPPDSSATVSGSVTSRPSGRSNIDRWPRSQRAKAVLIAFARSRNVCEGPTAKTRPGGGHSCSPRPPRSSTVTECQVRPIVTACPSSASRERPGRPRRSEEHTS